MRKIVYKGYVAFLFLMLSFNQIYAQGNNGLSGISAKMDSFYSDIMKIVGFILAIVFVVGIIHVVAAKSDRDPERFKKLIMNYAIAIVFVFVALAVIGVIRSSTTATS